MLDRCLLLSFLCLAVAAEVTRGETFQWSETKISTFRILPGQDLKVEIEQIARENHLQASSIITCVGSLRKTNLRLATQADSQSMKQIVLEEYFEITSLVGTIAYDPIEDLVRTHLHILLSDQNGRCVGGHLLEGSIVWTTAEVTIAEALQQKFSRHFDDTTGFRELVVVPS